MPGQQAPIPNPPTLPSNLPDSINSLLVQPKPCPLPPDDQESLHHFQRAAWYIAAAMIFLRDNTLLERPLRFEDIKPRLLGHWGTCPGLILLHAHLSLLIRNHDLDMIYVIGPGHGAPAALACLWLERSLENFYPGEYGVNREGLGRLIARFAVPGGFPSHINAETPGAIHEGGELGYALAVSFGAVMDKPDVIVACVVGDGEAETGATAAAWHAHKFIDPRESGAVLPILHVNGFKISERTIFGTMDDKELVALFSGYGWLVCIVDDLEHIDEQLYSALEWALAEIHTIQQAAREEKPILKPRWPMIVLKTPKGWTGPKEIDGKILEGSFTSHQVPLPKANSDKAHLTALQEWLSSYRIHELLDPEGHPVPIVAHILPQNETKRLGRLRLTHESYTPLNEVPWHPFSFPKGADASSMKAVGNYLDAVFQANPHTIRLFSPDELESNKLSSILTHTGRNFQWDEHSFAKDGRVIEVLSEHLCQGFMEGYTLTGRTGIFPSYEAFLGIVSTMVVQYGKFVKIAKQGGGGSRRTRWRGDLHSLNYIETSTWTRQEHNGFSHQNPGFVGTVLSMKAEFARVYFPPDANTFLYTLHHCLESNNLVNLLIGSKHPAPTYLSPEEASLHCSRGAGIFYFASSPGDVVPNIVLVGIGTELTFEVIAAASLLHTLVPHLRIRVVNVVDLMRLSAEGSHSHSLTLGEFEELFTADKPVLFNYHGYVSDLQALLFGRREGVGRMWVRGYREEGSTTTPFEMMVVNGVSRFDVVKWAIKRGVEGGVLGEGEGGRVLNQIERKEQSVRGFIREHGKDPDDMYDMPKFE